MVYFPKVHKHPPTQTTTTTARIPKMCLPHRKSILAYPFVRRSSNPDHLWLHNIDVLSSNLYVVNNQCCNVGTKTRQKLLRINDELSTTHHASTIHNISLLSVLTKSHFITTSKQDGYVASCDGENKAKTILQHPILVANVRVPPIVGRLLKVPSSLRQRNTIY